MHTREEILMKQGDCCLILKDDKHSLVFPEKKPKDCLFINFIVFLPTNFKTFQIIFQVLSKFLIFLKFFVNNINMFLFYPKLQVNNNFFLYQSKFLQFQLQLNYQSMRKFLQFDLLKKMFLYFPQKIEIQNLQLLFLIQFFV